MAVFFARRLAFVATLFIVGWLITRFVPSISDDLLLDIGVAAAVFLMIAVPLLLVLDDAEHDRPLRLRRAPR